MSNPLRLIELLNNVEQVQVEKESDEFKKGFSLAKELVFIHLSKNKDIFNLAIINKEQEKELELLRDQIKIANLRFEKYIEQYQSSIQNGAKKEFKRDIALNVKGLINKKAPDYSLERIDTLVTKWLMI